MPENGKVPLLDIQYNVDYDLEIVSQKDGKSTYGPWHFYQLMFQGKKFGHFAQPVLHEKLKEFSMGDRVIIQKQQTENDGCYWIVNGSDSQLEKPTQPISKQSTWDERTHDIHRQVCLKVAVMSFPSTDRPWSSEVVTELRRRTENLLVVLEEVDDASLSF